MVVTGGVAPAICTFWGVTTLLSPVLRLVLTEEPVVSGVASCLMGSVDIPEAPECEWTKVIHISITICV